jgi:hypothetical protein
VFGQHVRRLRGAERVQAPVERPPQPAQSGDDVARAERLGLVVEHVELGRQVVQVLLDVAIDAAHEALQDVARRAIGLLDIALGDGRDAHGAVH